MPDESGILVVNVPAASAAARAGLQKDDVILACNGQAARTLDHLQKTCTQAAGKKRSISIRRRPQPTTVEVGDYAYGLTTTR